MNKFVYLGLLILGLSKTVMYEFWYDYVKLKYGKNSKFTWMKYAKLYRHMDIYGYMDTWLYGYRQLQCSCKNRRYL